MSEDYSYLIDAPCAKCRTDIKTKLHVVAGIEHQEGEETQKVFYICCACGFINQVDIGVKEAENRIKLSQPNKFADG